MNHTRLAGAWFVAAAYAACASPGEAVPGQTLAQFDRWSAPRPLLRGLVRRTDELSGRPAYDLLTADHGVTWHFHATTDGAIVEAETLGVAVGTGEPGSAPISHRAAGYGYRFFASFYGTAIARDFSAAEPTAVVADPQSHVVSTFYDGKRFGYEVARGVVTVATLSATARALAQLRRCVAHPGACSE